MQRELHFNRSELSLLLLIIVVWSCDDFVEISPPKDELITVTVYNSDAAAESAMRGVYSGLASNRLMNGSAGSITGLGGMLADDFSTSVQIYDAYVTNAIQPTDPNVAEYWNGIYNIVYQTNAMIEGIQNSTAVSKVIQEQLIGEAKFIRAFCYFYLVNLWGDVPIVLTTDYRVNSVISRSPKQAVYLQIIDDLTEAKKFLLEDYSIGIGERTRVNKLVAAALLSRVYLYLELWSDAEIEASYVIDNVSIFSLQPDLGDVFIKNNTEAIWQYYPTQQLSYNTYEGIDFLPLEGAIPIPTILLQQSLLDAFEPDDDRATEWTRQTVVNGTPYLYAYKYRIYYDFGSTQYREYSVVLRLAEQYLIRAEARAEQGKLTGPNSAESDVNTIRNRAGLENTTARSKEALIDAVLHERRVELFGEWGHRWFDLIRRSRADTVLQYKPDWQPTDVMWPIPQRELDSNPNITQNDGY